MKKENYEELIKLNKAAHTIKDRLLANKDKLGDRDVWEIIYDKIFSEEISKRVWQLYNFDYYDPNTSYEEDVLAFLNAFDEELEHLKVEEEVEDEVTKILRGDYD